MYTEYRLTGRNLFNVFNVYVIIDDIVVTS
jgi:hypothetical protein